MVALDSETAADGVAVEVGAAHVREQLLEVVSELHDVPLDPLDVCEDGLRAVALVDGEIAEVGAWNMVGGGLWLDGELCCRYGVEGREGFCKTGSGGCGDGDGGRHGALVWQEKSENIGGCRSSYSWRRSCICL